MDQNADFEIYKNNIIKYYKNINITTSYDYHYHSSLLPLFLFLYKKSKKEYLNFVNDINDSLRQQQQQQIDSFEIKVKNLLNIEDYQSIDVFHETLNSIKINHYQNDSLVPMAVLESMISTSAIEIMENNGVFIDTINHIYNEIRKNTNILPTLKNYLHHLVYDEHFIPYNIVKKPYNTKQIRIVLQFMKVVWILEPEIIFTWINWGWTDIDGEIPLVLFALYYDCKSFKEERNHKQILYKLQEKQYSLQNFKNDIIDKINFGQYFLLDYLWERHLTISNETLFFILNDYNVNCSCYNVMIQTSGSSCRLKSIIKYWKLSNDRESRISFVRRLAYHAWSRKDGVGLYKIQHYLSLFNEEGEAPLLNINEFIIEMIIMDPNIIYRQDMLSWIINYSNTQQVKKLILYTLFLTLPNDPENIHLVKLILNFVGDIDLKGIQLLSQIDKDHVIWEELYPIIIIHLYRRYIRRKFSPNPEICQGWINLFSKLNTNEFELTSIQIRFQEELYEYLSNY
ncbi:hypothetical protein BCR36DRAFT_580032 [Piromyces finnis]|uniref:Uncharacterized protein n=1 Tax=Piromyces finnis TaxID=1754191 RepID=A0A1Y1VKJ0_9FUNG|nr:hypothetical protein BCR36DRAFT_580032 [Piromyces finnis]|eukprot:ORX58406.1 hypothetical protein BCR36DRAFT_580032 [Piromyces finnis]